MCRVVYDRLRMQYLVGWILFRSGVFNYLSAAGPTFIDMGDGMAAAHTEKDQLRQRVYYCSVVETNYDVWFIEPLKRILLITLFIINHLYTHNFMKSNSQLQHDD